MPTDTELESLQAQLVEPQTQVAFQEDTIAGLNTALAAQQRDLDLDAVLARVDRRDALHDRMTSERGETGAPRS